MTITPTYKFPSGYMGGHLPLASASLLSFLLTYLPFLRINYLLTYTHSHALTRILVSCARVDALCKYCVKP